MITNYLFRDAGEVETDLSLVKSLISMCLLLPLRSRFYPDAQTETRVWREGGKHSLGGEQSAKAVYYLWTKDQQLALLVPAFKLEFEIELQFEVSPSQ